MSVFFGILPAAGEQAQASLMVATDKPTVPEVAAWTAQIGQAWARLAPCPPGL